MIKCVIWDLDDTVFEGVLSESTAIAVRSGIAEVLSEARARGIVASIASRNDEQAALRALERAGIRDYFVYPQISWRSKSHGVAQILCDLHFRADNALFVDDRPFERDEVAARFPAIRTHSGADPQELLQLIRSHSKLATSADAQSRVAMYRLEERRLADRRDFGGSAEEFLAQCSIALDVRLAVSADIPRLAELLERTHQMSSARQVIDELTLEQMITCGPARVFVARVTDRYGSYGQCGLMICQDDGDDVLEVQALVISCRLMGKGIAQSLLAFACDLASEKQRRFVICRYLPTEFNRQIHLLFAMNGFARIEHAGDISYRLDTRSRSVETPTWVNRSASRIGNRREAAPACVF